MLRPALFMLLFSQVLLKKTFKDRKEKYDPLEKLRKQLNMPKESHSLFRSDRNLHNGQIDIILQSIHHSETLEIKPTTSLASYSPPTPILLLLVLKL